jgi:hypothetical protein
VNPAILGGVRLTMTNNARTILFVTSASLGFFACATDDGSDDVVTGISGGESEETADGDGPPQGCLNGVCERGESCDPDFGSRDMCTSDCEAMFAKFEAQSFECYAALDELVTCLSAEGCKQWANYWAGGTDHLCTAHDEDFRSICSDTSAWDDWK